MKATLKQQISRLPTMSADQVYWNLLGREGLYCIAMFGWKATKKQKDRIRYIWKAIIKTKLCSTTK